MDIEWERFVYELPNKVKVEVIREYVLEDVFGEFEEPS